MKKFLLPFQNMVQADLFSGSLAVWNAEFGLARIFSLPDPSHATCGEDKIPLELSLEYTVRKDFASETRWLPLVRARVSISLPK